MNCTFGASKGNSIHGAEREFMAEPIQDNEVVNSLNLVLHLNLMPCNCVAKQRIDMNNEEHGIKTIIDLIDER